MTGASPRRFSRALKFGAIFVLLAAVMPNVVYVGHWDAPTAGAHTHVQGSHGQQAPESSDDHAQHCHTGPAKCSGPQAIAGSIWVGEDAALLSLNAPARVAPSSDISYVTNTLGSRILQPPRAAV